MKRILFLLAIIFSIGASAQVKTPTTGPYAMYTQMWNPLSFYYNTVTSPSQLGVQLDTVVNVATLNLESSTFFIGTNGNPAQFVYPGSTKGISAFVNTDTVIVSAVDGWGQLTLTNATYKCTGTDTVVLTPISSSDGVIWVPIPGATAGSTLAVTIEPTSLTVPVVTKWLFITKPDKYVGIQVSNQKTSSTISTRCWLYFLKPQTINIK